MGRNIVEKIFEKHLETGSLKAGETVSLSIDQVLTQDATGTMAYLQFEAIGIKKIQVPFAVSYVDHNTIQSDYCNPDDHLYLQTAAAKYGAIFSRPGNGICHQVHLERFGIPGEILLGSDSHTPTGGGIGMIAIGVGGLDIATVMAGSPFELTMPSVIKINLRGGLNSSLVTGMDIILEVLRQLSVKGGVGKIIEYGGEGTANLNVVDRATITNMGAELGATTSVFPSDEKTLEFLNAQGRGDQWTELKADDNALYERIIDIDLNKLEPLIAKPHSPDNVVPVRKLAGLKVDQVCVGSCTNSSYKVMSSVAAILKGRRIAENCSMTISPGSKQVYEMMARNGGLADMIAAGARILESACGPCIGMGSAPPSNSVTLRSFNRNFKGRSGTATAGIFLCNPITAALAALNGEITDPLKSNINFTPAEEIKRFLINDNMLIFPPSGENGQMVHKGPNIKEVPVNPPLENSLSAKVIIKLEDNITTDDIMPAGSSILPLRSNIPAISNHVFERIDKNFPQKAREAGRSIIVAGENYGQGSSREHAAMAPMYLGIKAVVVKSFARIHKANLVNFGILPLEFEEKSDYDLIDPDNMLKIDNIISSIKNGVFTIENTTRKTKLKALCNVSSRQMDIIMAGGLLPFTRKENLKRKNM